jgi:Carboxymuconolactone decarboxylase family
MTTESIEPRIGYRKVAPEAIRALAAVERYARGSNLEPALLELVRLRASIINSCASSLVWTCIPKMLTHMVNPSSASTP